jgi:molybdopterin/thiamine biosynthesis adenylyltransferase
MTNSQSQLDEHALAPQPADRIRQRLDMTFIQRGRVVAIGLGGVGIPATRTVARFLGSICQAGPDDTCLELVLCDGDDFNHDNLYRMDVPQFGNKAEVLGAALLDALDCPNLAIRWVAEYVTADNISQLIEEGDCVLLACDNHQTRKLVGQYCAERLQNVVLISGGNDGLEDGLAGTYGNVQVHVRQDGHNITAPLTHYHPEIADPQDVSPADASCLELAAAGVPQLSFTNLAVASAMCNALLRLMMPGQQPMYDEVAFDVWEAISKPHWLSS